MTPAEQIVGCILTCNEEQTIARAITALGRVARSVVVVDSESSDRTREIAQSLGARVVIHPFESFPAQRNWAIQNIVVTEDPDFIATIDADEWLTDELIEDVARRLTSGRFTADAYLLHRRIRFDGRYLRWGGFSNTWLPRIFRPESAGYEDRGVNEHLLLPTAARLERLDGYLVNEDVVSWEEYISKHNRYSTLEARARVALASGREQRTPFGEALRRRYLRRRWLRQHVWDRLPGRPAIRFVQVYVLSGGVFDGRAGFHRALFEAWQEMCTDLKARAFGMDRRA